MTTTITTTTTGTDATLARLEEIRDSLRAELAVMSFDSPKRAYRCETLARIVRRIRDLKGE